MLKLLGIAWGAWKFGLKRFGPFGAVVFALVAVVAFTLVREYLVENHPRIGNALDRAA